MSQKITSKNLSYDTSLPPFLAALRAQASGATGPNPVLAQQRRAGKKRSSSEEAEDAPLVVDEDGNAVDIVVDDDGIIKEEQGKDSKDDGEPSAGIATDAKKASDGKATIGGRKRKVGKVVGDAAKESPDEAKGALAKKKTANGGEKTVRDGKSKDGKTKKAKKIKLSFDEEES